MHKIVFTGGGTAGHVMPNIVLIRRLLAEGWKVDYIGSKNGIEKQLIGEIEGVTYHEIRTGKLRRYHSNENFKDVSRVVAGVFEARELLKELQPDVIFSKGGFVSVPVVVGGGKIPTIIHESDYTPGLANRIAMRFADKVCVTFSHTLQHVGSKGVHTGTPIRPELYHGDRAAGLAFCGLTGEKPVLLVMGGSTGAQSLNNLVYEALPRLTQTFDVVHLCGTGKKNEEITCPGYVQIEYVNKEMADVFACADMVLSRAGANAVFEFLSLTKPAVLVPLPLSASRGDQIQNARYFEEKGYAVMVDQDTATADSMTDTVLSVFEHRKEYIDRMAGDALLDGTDEVLEEIYKEVR